MAQIEGEYRLATTRDVRYFILTVSPPDGRSALGSLPDDQTALREHLGCGRGCPIWLADAPWRETYVRPVYGRIDENVTEVLCPGIENPGRLGTDLASLPCYQKLCNGPMIVQYAK